MCYKCKQQGHIAKECPTKKKTKADESLICTCQESSKHPNLEASKEDEVGKEVESKPTCPTLGEELLKQYEPKKMEAPKESSILVPQVSVQTETIEEVQSLSKFCAPNSVITHLSCQEILNVVSGKGDKDTSDSSHLKEKPPDEPTKTIKLGIGIKKEHMKDVENDKESVKKDVQPLPLIKLQDELLDVVTKLHEQFDTKPSKSEVHNYISNSLSLDILNQLLVYVKGLLEVKEPERMIVKTPSIDSAFLMIKEDSNYQLVLRRLCILESIITHLFLAIEVECFADTKGELGDDLYKLGYELHLKERPEIVSAPTNAKVWVGLLKSDLNYTMTVIICLFLSMSVNKGLGQIKRLMEQGDVKEEPPDSYHEDQTPKSHKEATKGDEDDEDYIQLKEKPPDEQPIFQKTGKLLNPFTLQWTNLTYLCVGKQVLRSKLFEEGGYDEDIEPTRRTPEELSAQNDLKIDFKNSSINMGTFLAHPESHTKKNQPIISSHQGDMDFTSQVYSRLADLDLCALFGVQRPAQEELSCKPNWNRILAHNRRFESWFCAKPRSDERDIKFTSQPDFNQSALKLLALFGEPRLTQKELSCEINYVGKLTHQGRAGIWNHINPNPYEQVMEFTKPGNLHLPYLLARDFPCLQVNAFKTQGQRLYSHLSRLGSVIKRQSSHGITLKISRYKLPPLLG